VGAVAEGMRQLDAALGLDPFVPLACSAQVRALALLGRWDEAVALHAQVREREGAISFWALGARMALWRRVPAEAYAEEVPRDVEKGLIWAMGEVIRTRRLPDGVPTLAELDRIVEGSPRRKVLFFQMHAEIMASVGDAARALEGISAAESAGLVDVFWLDRCPLLATLREDARFAALHARVARRAAEALDGAA
jgi:serine/threonine-protein kinase